MIHGNIINLKRTLLYICLTLVVLLPAGIEKRSEAKDHPAGKETEALVREIVHAYGGETVLKNSHSLSAEGLIESPLYEGPAEYSFSLKRDRKLRVETRSGGSFEVRILNGRNGNYQAAGSPTIEASGSRLLSMIYQFKELTMPYQLMTSAFTITVGEPKLRKWQTGHRPCAQG